MANKSVSAAKATEAAKDGDVASKENQTGQERHTPQAMDIVVIKLAAGAENSVITIQPGKLYQFGFKDTDVTSMLQDKSGDLTINFKDGGSLVLRGYDKAVVGDTPANFAFSDRVNQGTLAELIEIVDTTKVEEDKEDEAQAEIRKEVLAPPTETAEAKTPDAAMAEKVAAIEPAAGSEEATTAKFEELFVKNLLKVQPAAGEERAVALNDIEPASGGVPNSGYGFGSTFAATPLNGLNPVGPLGSTEIPYAPPPPPLLPPIVPPNFTPQMIKPGEHVLDETDFAGAPLVATGNIEVDFGGDAPGPIMPNGTITFSGSAKTDGAGHVLSHGVPVLITATADGYVGRAGGVDVFKLVIDPVTGDYVFTLFEPLDHADGANPDDAMTFVFGVKATDGDGDSQNTTITVTVKDDAPGIVATDSSVDETFLVPGGLQVTGTITPDFGADGPHATNPLASNGQFSFSGSAKTDGAGHVLSGGVPVLVTSTANGYVGKAGGVDVFTVVLDPLTNTYKFTLLRPLDHADATDPNDVITLRFGVNAVDYDGDATSTTFDVKVYDDGPVIAPAENIVDETDFGPVVVSGTFTGNGGQDIGSISPGNAADVTFTGHVGGANLLSQGQVVTIKVEGNKYIGTRTDGSKVFELVVNNDKTYQFTAIKPLDHADNTDPDDRIVIDFGIKIVDGDGDQGTSSIRINWDDDGPFINDSSLNANENALLNGDIVVNGTLAHGYGEDGPGRILPNGDRSVTYTIGGAPQTLKAGGQNIDIQPTTNGYEGKVGNDLIFKITIDPATGNHTYTQYKAVDHPAAGEDFVYLNFGVKILDQDSDSDNGVIRIALKDTVPVAHDDCPVTDAQGHADGNVITGRNGGVGAADVKSADEPTKVFKISFEGRDVLVPQDGTNATINGKYGTLTINKDGEYDYQAHSVPAKSVYVYDKDNPPGSDASGDIKNVTTTFSPDTNQFTFSTTVATDKGVNGFALALNGGGNPKGHSAEMAHIFFDATGNGTPKISIYAYNGDMGHTSWYDGSKVAGLQLPDKILNSIANGNLFSSIQEVQNGDGTVTYSFSLDASIIQNHVPLNGPVGQWSGVEFAEKIGMWLQPVHLNATQYNNEGYLLKWDANANWSYYDLEWDNAYLDHGNLNVHDEFQYMIVDADGDMSTAKLKFDVNLKPDDHPEIGDDVNAVDEMMLLNGDIIVRDKVTRDFGDDGPGQISPTGRTTVMYAIGGPNQILKSCGEEVHLNKTATGYVGVTDSGVVVLTLDIDPLTGDYVYTQKQALDHPGVGKGGTDDVIWLKFEVQIADKDGDTDIGVIQIDVRDSVPIANNDCVIMDANGDANGNVITGRNGGAGAADKLSGDEPTTVTKISFGGKNVNVPQDGSYATIHGDHGTLHINKNGEYTYDNDIMAVGSTTYIYSKVNPAGSDAAGDIKHVGTSFNATTNFFTFEVTVDASKGVDGFALALNGGGNPKGHSAEMAHIFFDATGAQPVVSMYAYNGLDAHTSWQDGSKAAGIQTPDKILNSIANGNLFGDISVTEVNGEIKYRFTIDATTIQNHVPINGPASDWTGVEFANKIGMWLHPVNGLSTSYDTQGYLTKWTNSKNTSSYDLEWDNTTPQQNYPKTDKFTYMITDKDGDSSTATLEVKPDGKVCVDNDQKVDHVSINMNTTYNTWTPGWFSGKEGLYLLGSVNLSDKDGSEVVQFIDVQLSYSKSRIVLDRGTYLGNDMYRLTVDQFYHAKILPDPAVFKANASRDYIDSHYSGSGVWIKAWAKVVEYSSCEPGVIQDTKIVKYQKDVIITPLVFDLDGDGIELVEQKHGVLFDMDNDGVREYTSWVKGDDGLLALDSNGDGVINNQSELFGGTDKFDNGFAKLASYDDNQDGIIDAQDAIWGLLTVWQDANQNGVSEDGEMTGLDAHGITSIFVNATEVDYTIADSKVTHESVYTNVDGLKGAIVDAWFAVSEPSEVITLSGDDETTQTEGDSSTAFIAENSNVIDITALIERPDAVQDSINDFVVNSSQEPAQLQEVKADNVVPFPASDAFNSAGVAHNEFVQQTSVL